MPVPTEAVTKTLWKDVTNVYEKTRIFGATASTGMLGLINTVVTELEGDYTTEVEERLVSSRARLNGLLTEAAAALEPIFRTYGQVMAVPEVDPQSILTRLYDRYHDNTEKIASRQFIFGTPTLGSTVNGNGQIFTLNLDANGYVIENQHGDARTAECIADAATGTELWEEVFEFRGAAAARDAISLSGSGARQNLAFLSARASTRYLRNPSFSQGTPSGIALTPTDITDWTSSITINSTNFEFIGATPYGGGGASTSTYYRSFPGDSTPLALRCKANAFILSQNLETTNRARFEPGLPYFLQVAIKKNSAADGTVIIRLGAQSITQALSGLTNNHWSVVQLGPGTANWYKNFRETNLTFEIERSAGTTGWVDFDDIILSPYVPFDGGWYAGVGTPSAGPPVQHLRGDRFTWTYGSQVHSVLGYWTWAAFGRYLPAAPLGPTSACTASVGGAGNVNTGGHTWRYTFARAIGPESNGNTSTSAQVSVPTAAKQINLTGITAGPTGTVSRGVYRTVAGDTGAYLLVGYVSDNSTTVYTDDIADGSLGATLSAGITVTDPS